MKKIYLLVFFLGSITFTQAQIFNFGIKGGVNFNSNGDLRQDLTGLKLSSDQETGYQVGFLTEMKLPLWLYLRPEIYYTHTKSSYDYEKGTADLTLDKIDIPVLLGLRFLKIGRIFLGPTFHYAFNTKLDVDDLKNVSSDDFTFGAQFGAGLEFGKFGVDVRWEKGLSNSEARFVYKNIELLNEFTADTSQQQFLVNLYYKFH